MTSAKTFEYLTGYLSGAISPVLNKKMHGKYDKQAYKGKVAYYCTLLEGAMFRDGNGRFLTDSDGRLRVYNGEYYEEVSDRGFMKELVKRVLSRLGIGATYQKLSAGYIANECMDGLRSCDDYRWESDRRYVCFSNGVLDLKDGKLKKFDMRYRTDLVLDIPYDPKSGFLLWDIKIKEIIPEKEMREAFQMFCGTLLVKREELKFEYICYLIGTGSNGKSVAASAIAGVFGEKYFSKFTPWDLFKASDAKVNMAALEGKIGNFTDDLEDKDISGGAFKRFISGEKFQARRLYGNPFLVQAPVMLCCTNAMPETSDDSWGHHRRQLPIYTTRRQWTEEDKDPYLAQKLATPEARQRIFLWIYEGYKKIMRNGGNIKLGRGVVEAQRELQDDSSSMRRWFRDMGYVAAAPAGKGDARWRPLKSIYSEYRTYAEDSGYSEAKKRSDIGALLRSKGIAECRRSDGVYFCLGRINVDTGENGELITKIE